MAGLIGADNRFGKDFGHPDANMQGNIVALYDVQPLPSSNTNHS